MLADTDAYLGLLFVDEHLKFIQVESNVQATAGVEGRNVVYCEKVC
jgi:hypothetical protein